MQIPTRDPAALRSWSEARSKVGEYFLSAGSVIEEIRALRAARLTWDTATVRVFRHLQTDVLPSMLCESPADEYLHELADVLDALLPSDNRNANASASPNFSPNDAREAAQAGGVS
jgi:hypothetical protein